MVPGVSDHDAVLVSFIAEATYHNEIKHIGVTYGIELTSKT